MKRLRLCLLAFTCLFELSTTIEPSRASEYQDGYAAYQHSNYEEALRHWLPLAEAGDPDAQFGVGLIFDRPKYSQTNTATAFKWYVLAANQDQVQAQFWTGRALYIGDGVQVDEALGVFWLKRGAVMGDVNAQELLAEVYAFQEGLFSDDKKAAFWAGKAMAQESAIGYRVQAKLLRNGRGVRKNTDEAIRLFLKSIELGDDNAEFELGELYLDGDAGVLMMPWGVYLILKYSVTLLFSEWFYLGEFFKYLAFEIYSELRELLLMFRTNPIPT